MISCVQPGNEVYERQEVERIRGRVREATKQTVTLQTGAEE